MGLTLSAGEALEGAVVPTHAYKPNWGYTAALLLAFSHSDGSQTPVPFQGCGDFRTTSKPDHAFLAWLCTGTQAGLAAGFSAQGR